MQKPMTPKQPSGLNENQNTSCAALIIIDMINDLEFPGASNMFDAAVETAENIARLKERARREKLPVIYANDNFGRWRSDFVDIVHYCLGSEVRGRPLAEILKPVPDDYFILKPRHSAFYATPLEQLLSRLGCGRLVLCGISGNMCVQFTACDAYMRDYELHVPEDCMASRTEAENRQSLEYMQGVLGADTTGSGELKLSRLREK